MHQSTMSSVHCLHGCFTVLLLCMVLKINSLHFRLSVILHICACPYSCNILCVTSCSWFLPHLLLSEAIVFAWSLCNISFQVCHYPCFTHIQHTAKCNCHFNTDCLVSLLFLVFCCFQQLSDMILTCYHVCILICLSLNLSTVHNLSLPSYHAIITPSFSYPG